MAKSGPGAELAAYLKMLRESNGLSQPELAYRLGLAHQSAAKKGSKKTAGALISKFENQHRIPDELTLDRYGELRGADANTLERLAGAARAARRPGRPAHDAPQEPTTRGPEREPGEDEGEQVTPKPWWRRRWVWPLGLLLGLIVVAGAVSLVIAVTSDGGGASLSVLYARDGQPIAVRTCANTACRGTSLPTGTKVKMICFRDAQDTSVNYSSPRWFNVREPRSGKHGWVHSSEVYHQTRVGPC